MSVLIPTLIGLSLFCVIIAPEATLLILLYAGHIACAAVLGKILKAAAKPTRRRERYGWPIDKAIKTPVQGRAN